MSTVVKIGAVLGVMAVGLGLPNAAQGQRDVSRRLLGSFLSVSGHFASGTAARNAFGNAVFLTEATIHSRLLSAGGIELSGGLEFINASDHFLPFSDSNNWSLLGGSVRVTTKRKLGQPRPYASLGLYAGHLDSDRLARRVTQIVPGAAVGVEWPVTRYITLSAGYRVTSPVGDIALDGFNIGLRIF